MQFFTRWAMPNDGLLQCFSDSSPSGAAILTARAAWFIISRIGSRPVTVGVASSGGERGPGLPYVLPSEPVYCPDKT